MMTSPDTVTGPSALAAQNVGVSFAGLRALHAVTIAVAPAEIVGIIGPNGSGKTTLFDCLSGYTNCEGTMQLLGREISGLSPHRRAAAGLARSFQDARLFPSMTVLDTLRVACELAVPRPGALRTAVQTPTARRAERVATQTALELCTALGIRGFRDKLVRELSTGSRRLVDLACLLARQPVVILLDEPSAGIAQRETEALAPVLLRLREYSGSALVVVEHDIPLLTSIADRMYALETGEVIASGAPQDVIRHPEVVRSYLGGDTSALVGSTEAKA